MWEHYPSLKRLLLLQSTRYSGVTLNWCVTPHLGGTYKHNKKTIKLQKSVENMTTPNI